MDCSPVEERDFVIDIESSVDMSNEVESPDLSNDKNESTVSITICSLPVSVDESILSSSLKKAGEVSPDIGKNAKKEKRKSTSAKRPPKPPRPPRGYSLDAADQKLIKEIAELAMMKRARIERMKALKKLKATKSSSTSASSSGNLLAMLFTILFCIVIIFQGCHSSGISSSNSSETVIHSSLEPVGATEGNIFGVQNKWTIPTTTAQTGFGSASPKNPIPSSDGKYEDEKAID